MEFSECLDPFSHFNNDPFGNILDEDIPQDIFDDIMNDVNLNAMGFDVNSLSSEDSGRSSSSYDDVGSRLDTFSDQTMTELPQIKTENIKDEPKSPINVSNELNQINNTTKTNEIHCLTNETVKVSQPIFATTQQTTFTTQIQQQPQLVLSQPKILVKREPIKFNSQSNQQQILTLQNIGGQLYTTVTNPNQSTVHAIVNGQGMKKLVFFLFEKRLKIFVVLFAGILTKIPLVPVTSVIQPQTFTTQKLATVATVVQQPQQQSQPKQQTMTTTASASVPKTAKKSGHNIIERRYRTSIVSNYTCSIFIFALFFFE